MRNALFRGALALPLLVGIAATFACSGQVTVAPVTFTPYGSCDSFDGAALIPSGSDYATYCPGLSCEGAYYALCNGTAWDSCACGVPDGDTEISWSNYGGGVGSGTGNDAGDGLVTEAGGTEPDADETGVASEDADEGGTASEDAFDASGGCTGGDF
jgi:hypothetical protein